MKILLPRRKEFRNAVRQFGCKETPRRPFIACPVSDGPVKIGGKTRRFKRTLPLRPDAMAVSSHFWIPGKFQKSGLRFPTKKIMLWLL